MRRRDFIVTCVAAACPLPARAQQVALPVVGFLNSQSPATFGHLATAFQEGLEEVGFCGGQNVAIEYRWAEGAYDRLVTTPPATPRPGT